MKLNSRTIWLAGGFIFLLTFVMLQTLSFANTLNLTITDTGFIPTVIKAKENETLTLIIHNQGTKIHNFVAPDLYMFTHNLQPGEKVTVQFILNKKGSFPFYSDATGSIEQGLTGTLVIE